MKILMELDKAGAEWVVVAYLSGDANMLEVLNSGKSPHTVTGSLISGAPEEFVERENKLVGHHTDPDTIRELREQLEDEIDPNWFMPRIFSIRQMGKKSNHGLNYDMKYKRFALENEMPENDSKTIVDFYHTRAYPGIRGWHKTVQHQLNEDRTLVNCFGRKRKFMDAWGPELFDAAYAFVPQSTVFDTTRIGMVKLWNDNSKEAQQVELLAQTHDSCTFQLEADLDLLTQMSMRIGLDYMCPTCIYNSREFIIGTDMKIGFEWGEGMSEVKLSDNDNETRSNIEKVLKELKDGKEAA